MTNIFVVTYQLYLYGEEVYDYKDMMLNPVSVKGVFSTKKKAEDFIKKDLKKNTDEFYGDDDPDLKENYIEKEEYHYSIHILELDKLNGQ